jgi:hypothetical protein
VDDVRDPRRTGGPAARGAHASKLPVERAAGRARATARGSRGAAPGRRPAAAHAASGGARRTRGRRRAVRAARQAGSIQPTSAPAGRRGVAAHRRTRPAHAAASRPARGARGPARQAARARGRLRSSASSGTQLKAHTRQLLADRACGGRQPSNGTVSYFLLFLCTVICAVLASISAYCSDWLLV